MAQNHQRLALPYRLKLPRHVVLRQHLVDPLRARDVRVEEHGDLHGETRPTAQIPSNRGDYGTVAVKLLITNIHLFTTRNLHLELREFPLTSRTRCFVFFFLRFFVHDGAGGGMRSHLGGD